MSDEVLTEIWNGMVARWGDNLPDPEHCPIQFKQYFKLYMYYYNVK